MTRELHCKIRVLMSGPPRTTYSHCPYYTPRPKSRACIRISGVYYRESDIVAVLSSTSVC